MISLLFLVVLCGLLFPTPVLASTRFVTLVNPVRVAPYTGSSVLPGLTAQYNQVKFHKFPATWLLTYDVLQDKAAVNFLKNLDSGQELGLFLEVTPNLASAAGISYHQVGDWHFASAVFLSGYSPREREKLLDTLIADFINKFSQNPHSVGSWGTDSWSLNYLSRKYHITANLSLADQFSTDNYQVWGTYWSQPFYPSIYHPYRPAQSLEEKLDLVSVPWAPRDPLRGYASSLFSTQDYYTLPQPLTEDYFSQLLYLYALNPLQDWGQINIGLEADLDPAAYATTFSRQLDSLKGLPPDIKVVNLSGFSAWYRKQFPKLSPPGIIFASDLLGSSGKAIWYQSPFYRIGLNLTSTGPKIIDWRVYPQNFLDPYLTHANPSRDLNYTLPSVIDSLTRPNEIWDLSIGQLISSASDSGHLGLLFTRGRLDFYPDHFTVSGTSSLPHHVHKSPYLKIISGISTRNIYPKTLWPFPAPGWQFRYWSPETLHVFSSLKSILRLFIGLGWTNISRSTYFVSQSELEALAFLKLQPAGKVVVPAGECLQCDWSAPFRPAVFANLHQYVQQWSLHPVISSASLFNDQDRLRARNTLRNLNAAYIYTVTYGSYREQVPFSPGDLNVELIFANSGAQVWRVR